MNWSENFEASEREPALLWNAVPFGVLGILIGFRYRAPALVPATLSAAVWSVATGWAAQRTYGEIAAMAVLLAVFLNVAYLVALALRTLGGRC